PRLPEEEQSGLPARCTKSLHLEAKVWVQALKGRSAKGRDDRRGDYRLCDDDRRSRIEEVQLPERAGPPEHDRYEQADGDRGQGHSGVESAERERAAGGRAEG